MLRLVLAFVDIALHRRGPEYLPASRFLLGLVLAVYVLVGLVVLQPSNTFATVASFLLFDTVLYLGLVWVVLQTFDHRRRFLQTMTALCGTDTLLRLLAVPLVGWSRALEAAEDEWTVPGFLLLLLFCWSIDVSAFVLSRALDRPYVVGMAIVIGYVLLSISLRATLFPVDN